MTEFFIDGKKVNTIGDVSAEKWFIQPTGAHETGYIAAEYDGASKLSGDGGFCIAAFEAADWNRDLSPWRAKAVFGNEDFGDGAAVTLGFIENSLLPYLDRAFSAVKREYYVCGYSLAGLFALWAVYRSERFAGAAGVSPSVWFPGWDEYADGHRVLCRKVYLSLGDREEKTKNPVLATVGDALRRQYARLDRAEIRSVLEWNAGNHFTDPAGRLAKGISWLENN